MRRISPCCERRCRTFSGFMYGGTLEIYTTPVRSCTLLNFKTFETESGPFLIFPIGTASSSCKTSPSTAAINARACWTRPEPSGPIPPRADIVDPFKDPTCNMESAKFGNADCESSRAGRPSCKLFDERAEHQEARHEVQMAALSATPHLCSSGNESVHRLQVQPVL